jgi:hypothetical protein
LHNTPLFFFLVIFSSTFFPCSSRYSRPSTLTDGRQVFKFYCFDCYLPLKSLSYSTVSLILRLLAIIVLIFKTWDDFWWILQSKSQDLSRICWNLEKIYRMFTSSTRKLPTSLRTDLPIRMHADLFTLKYFDSQVRITIYCCYWTSLGE